MAASEALPELSTVSLQRRDRVLLIGLNRPAKSNAFNLAMLRELAEAYTAYERDASLWCAVLFAHGKNFTGGLDLVEVGPAVAAGESLAPDGLIDPLDMRREGPRRSKPVVVALHGWCMTIGVELALASDICVAARGARFSQMEVKRGIMPFGGATLRFPRVAGWGNAMRYMLTGDVFDADEALRLGVVQEVTAPEEQLARAISIAERVAEQAPLAVTATRVAARVAIERGDAAALGELMAAARGLMETEDAVEGMRSFAERRAAAFKGR
ncbi:MAG: crotonase/enoyl-CoA hydratase family protein [Myxococcales bacterium]|nr:crotonase/enoyl-CoA hydratase family protein [Myxococcales bacterium]